jgi:hypothetical protein
MFVIVALVVNHSSAEHPRFLPAASVGLAQAPRACDRRHGPGEDFDIELRGWRESTRISTSRT